MNGTEPSPQSVTNQNALFSAHKVKVFVHNQQARTLAAQKPRFLRFKSRNHHARGKILAHIARRNANIPSAGAPFREFVIS